MTGPTAERPWFRAAPDGLIAAVLLSFLATAGLFYVNIMAALVDGLESALGFSARDAGFVASANVYGAALGALIAVPLVGRLPWQRVAVFALIAMVAVDLGSMLIKLPAPLIGARFLHGLIGGFLVGTAFSVIARTRTPDRVFGMLLVVQFGLGGVGLMFLPRLVPLYGTPALFLALSAFSLVTLALLPFLDTYAVPAPPVREEGAARPRIAWVPLLAALVAVFLFQASNMGLAAFIIGLGKGYGLEPRYVSDTLGIANWIGAAGSVLVVVLGLRFGRTGPILLGLAATLGGTALFFLSHRPWAYAAANVITAVTWSYVIAYLLGLCAAFDKGGRSAALAGFFSKMGLASGPALAGVLLHETRYPTLILLTLVGLALCAAAALWPAARLDRQA